MDTKTQLRGIYGRLIGIKAAAGSSQSESVLPATFGIDYDGLVDAFHSITKENVDTFKLPPSAYFRGSDNLFVYKAELNNKISQLLQYLNYMYHVNEDIIEIGSIYNSISDEELKSRCSDLLSAPSHFDRVINQATQVLEDRLRAKGSSIDDVDIVGQSGVQLANRLLKTNLSESPIVFSSDQNEHEGYCHIFRGVMGALRNPTHHRLIEDITREQALQVCAFIDNLLRLLDKATVAGK